MIWLSLCFALMWCGDAYYLTLILFGKYVTRTTAHMSSFLDLVVMETISFMHKAYLKQTVLEVISCTATDGTKAANTMTFEMGKCVYV